MLLTGLPIEEKKISILDLHLERWNCKAVINMKSLTLLIN